MKYDFSKTKPVYEEEDPSAPLAADGIYRCRLKDAKQVGNQVRTVWKNLDQETKTIFHNVNINDKDGYPTGWFQQFLIAMEVEFSGDEAEVPEFPTLAGRIKWLDLRVEFNDHFGRDVNVVKRSLPKTRA